MNERIKKGFTELGIVVLGVMIALAADSWREDWLESRIEARYLERLKEDVTASLSVLNIERSTYQAVLKGAAALTEQVDESGPSLDSEYLIEQLVAATQMGFSRNEMSSDVTYREMIASGQLNLIRNQPVRESVVKYYRNVELLIDSLLTLPLVNERFAEQTGHFPIAVTELGVSLTPQDKDRLLAVLRDDLGLTMQLRSLHAQVLFNDRLFDLLIAQAQELISLLE